MGFTDKAAGAVWGLCLPEADETFCENMLFCHGFKNDIAIFAFVGHKWKKNQFGDRKVVGQSTMLAHWVQKVTG